MAVSHLIAAPGLNLGHGAAGRSQPPGGTPGGYPGGEPPGGTPGGYPRGVPPGGTPGGYPPGCPRGYPRRRPRKSCDRPAAPCPQI